MKNTALNEYLNRLLGDERAGFLNAAPEPAAIRVNKLNGRSAARMIDRLGKYNRSLRPISFSQTGFVTDPDTLPFSHTLDFFCGHFQYQGVSSQLPALILNPQPGEKALDMAAAPGSKSTQLADLMQNRGMLYLNDWSHKRLPSLQTNTQRAGVMNQIILNLPGERLGNLLPEYFDKILLDAPCTGTGTIPDHPEVVQWWTPGKLQKLTLIQEQLLISAYKALRPGGELVYSTCSVCVEENEALLERFLSGYAMEILDITLPGREAFDPGLICSNGQSLRPEISRAIRIWPHRHGLEGFFIIRLRKTGPAPRRSPENTRFRPTLAADDAALRPVLENLGDYWSIPNHFLENFSYILTADRLWITGKDLQETPETGFNCAGLLFAERRSARWKLFNQAVQFLGNRIGDRRVTFSDGQLQQLFRQGYIENSALPNGYFALFREEEAIAALYAEGGMARIKLPHRFPEIIMPPAE
jgi:NOL1/NOP2/sun family putative RNA methylase